MVIQGAHLYLRVRLSTVSMLLRGELIRRQHTDWSPMLDMLVIRLGVYLMVALLLGLIILSVVATLTSLPLTLGDRYELLAVQ